MAVDPSIVFRLQGADPSRFANAMQTGMVLRDTRNKLIQGEQEQARQNKLREFLSTADVNAPQTRNQLLGMGPEGMEYVKGLDERQKAALEQQKTKLDLLKKSATFIMANPQMAEQALMDFGARTGEDVTDDVAQLRALGGNPEAIRQWAAGHAMEADKLTTQFEKFSLGDREVRQGFDPLTGAPVGKGVTMRRGMNPGEAERIDLDRQRLGLEERRVAVSEAEAAKKPTDGSKPMTELQLSKRRDQLAKDYRQVEAVNSSMDELLSSIKAVRETADKGLEGATGISSYVPASGDSDKAIAQNRLTNLEGKVTKLGKEIASASGAMGPMAVQEWTIVRDMVASLDRTKGAKALLEQLDLVEAQARGAIERMRDSYEKQHMEDFERFPQFATTTKPKDPAAGEVIEVDW